MSAHSRFRHNVRIQLAVFFLVAGSATYLFAQGAPFAGGTAVETAPAFESPDLSLSLLDFATGLPIAKKVKELFPPKLLREPFAGAPVDTAKGLAAKIQAEQIDVENRITAAEFLAEVDCRAYPDAQKQLIKLILEDPSEEVRLAAVEAIQVHFSRGLDCEKASKREKRRYDTCRGCCTQKAINAVFKVAYEMDPDFPDCMYEPSKRVRKEAAKAVEICRDLCEQRGMEQEPEATPKKTEAAPATPIEKAPAKKTTDKAAPEKKQTEKKDDKSAKKAPDESPFTLTE